MKRLLCTILVFSFLISILPIASTGAQEAPIATVKVTGYTFTKDGRVRPFSQGSATILTANGYLLTNHHVTVDGEEETHDIFEICLTYPSNLFEPQCTGTATHVTSNKKNDIAVLKMETRDIFGQEFGTLPTLNFESAVRPTVGEEVTMIGYPDIGQDSVTYTNGKVSGFVTLDGTEYFKSDAKISNGNSGGTAINKQGQFIGIPSAGDSSYASLETLGFILPVADHRDWIRTGISAQPKTNIEANAKLREQMRILYDANKSRTLEVSEAPGFSIAAEPGWKFSSNAAALNEFSRLGNFSLSSKDGSAYVSIDNNTEAYEKTVDKLAEEQHRTDRSLRALSGYKVEQITLNGKYPALKLSLRQKDYLTEGGKQDRVQTEYRIPFGTAVVTVASSYVTAEPKQNEEDVNRIIASLALDQETKPDFAIASYQGKEPVIRLENPKPAIWQMVEEYYERRAPDLALRLENPADDKARIAIGYDKYNDAGTDADYTKFLENLVKDSKEYSTLLNSGSNLTIGGKQALFVLTKDLSEFNEDPLNPFVALNIFIPDGQYYFSVSLNCQSKNYENYLVFLKKLLSTASLGGETDETDLSGLGTLDGVFLDTANHRYEKEIGALKEEGIVRGYGDKTFRPYKPVTRAEFLKLALSAMPKKELATLREGLARTGSGTTPGANRFNDVDGKAWYAPYVSHALGINVVAGYSDKSFRPTQAITLAEGLKIILLSHGITLWKPLPGDNAPWFLPYLDKAYELNLLVPGMTDPSHVLLRGEVAHLLYTLRQSDKNKYDL